MTTQHFLEKPGRWWWIALLVILLLGGMLRLTGYNFSLPYIDHVDEPNHNLSARFILDYGSSRPMGSHGYPPGIITLHYLALRWLHDPAQPPSMAIGTVRLASVAVSTGTLLVVALLGWRTAGLLAGLLAAGSLAVAPLAVEYGRLAVPDAHVTFWAALALLLAVWGTQSDHDRLITWGVVALVLAIIFKYQAAVLAVPVLGLPLLRLWTLRPSERRRVLKNLVANLGVLAVFFAWLFLIYPVLQTEGQHEIGWNMHVDAVGLPPLARLWTHTRIVAEDLTGEIGWLLALAGWGLPIVYSEARRKLWLPGVVTLLLAAALIIGAVSAFEDSAYRQLASAVPPLAVLLGIGWALWSVALTALLRRWAGALSVERGRMIAGGVVVLVAVLVVLPHWRITAADAYNRTLPDRRNDLAVYMDTSVPPGAYISPSSNHKTFNPDWGGYTGVHEFPHIETANLTERSLEEWREMGVTYAILDMYEYEMLVERDDPLLEETLLLKTYPPDTAYRGPSMAVLRLWPIQYEAEGMLGSIRLVGYDLDRSSVAPGESITLTLYWQADAPTSGEYVVYNHLTPLDSRDIIAQADGPPLFDLRRTTADWDDPAETLISRPFTLTIPEDTPPADCRLLTGFYSATDGTRLHTPGGDDYLLVATITVEEMQAMDSASDSG